MMEINNKKIKAIRYITEDEYKKWINSDLSFYGFGMNNIFVIDFIDGSTLLPDTNCINCMSSKKCMLNQIQSTS